MGKSSRRNMSLARELWWDALGGAEVNEYEAFEAGWSAARRAFYTPEHEGVREESISGFEERRKVARAEIKAKMHT